MTVTAIDPTAIATRLIAITPITTLSSNVRRPALAKPGIVRRATIPIASDAAATFDAARADSPLSTSRMFGSQAARPWLTKNEPIPSTSARRTPRLASRARTEPPSTPARRRRDRRRPAQAGGTVDDDPDQRRHDADRDSATQDGIARTPRPGAARCSSGRGRTRHRALEPTCTDRPSAAVPTVHEPVGTTVGADAEMSGPPRPTIAIASHSVRASGRRLDQRRRGDQHDADDDGPLQADPVDEAAGRWCRHDVHQRPCTRARPRPRRG